jgi:hypothetical protein
LAAGWTDQELFWNRSGDQPIGCRFLTDLHDLPEGLQAGGDVG